MKNNNPIRKNPLPMFLRKKMAMGGDEIARYVSPTPIVEEGAPYQDVMKTGDSFGPINQSTGIGSIPRPKQYDWETRAVQPFNIPQHSSNQFPIVDSMYIANVGMRGLSEMYARNQQEQYQQANTANPLANLPFNDGRSDRVKYGYEQFAEGGLYDYLQSTGRTGAKGYGDTRKALAAQLGIKDYSGTAEQNIKLLSILKDADERGVSPMSRTISSASANPTRQMSPAPKIEQQRQPETQVKQRPDISFLNNTPSVRDLYNQAQNQEVSKRPAQIDTSSLRGITDSFKNTGYARPQELQAPNSGVVVDKRTGKAYITEGGKVIKRFPVLTGADVESNINSINVLDSDNVKNGKSTPVGYYQMHGKDKLYDTDIAEFDGNVQRMSAISGPGMKAPLATGLGIHQTYDPEHRNKLFNTDSPYASFGCINCHKPDIKDINRRFPQGDTLMVIDSKDPKFSAINNKMKAKKKGGVIRGLKY